MADNVEITAGAGTTVRTDQLSGGQHVQYVKLMSASSDSEELIRGGSAFGLQVDVRRLGRSFDVNRTTATSGTMDATAIASCPARLTSILFHLSASASSSGNFTATLDSIAGSAYDTKLVDQSMVGVTDLIYFPDGDLFLLAGDAIDYSYANPDNRVMGAAIYWELL